MLSDRADPAWYRVGVQRAFEKFLDTNQTPRGVRKHVADSWRRSYRTGVDYDSRVLPPLLYTPDRLEDYRASHTLAAGRPAVQALHQSLETAGDHLVVISDAEGVLLWVEGPERLRCRAGDMNFVAGAAWDEKHAGTNAPGVALTTGRDIEILAGEHYSRVVRDWSCAASVIHQPETGDVVGVVDLTWPGRQDNPHALSLVHMAAAAIEHELTVRSFRRRGVAEQRYAERALRTKGPTALVGPAGRILLSPADGALVGRRVGVTNGRSAGEITLADGRSYETEDLGCPGYFLLHLPGGKSDTRRRAVRSRHRMSLRALGRDEAVLDVDGRSITLRPRFAEIVVLLAMHPEGMSCEKLALHLLGDESVPVTVRAEISRLRGALGDDLLDSRPYRLNGDIDSDFSRVRASLRSGRLRSALRDYSGPLLPCSEAPGIVDERNSLEAQLRAAVLSTRDPGLIRRWVDSPWGREDPCAWDALAAGLPTTSNERASATAQAELLRS